MPIGSLIAFITANKIPTIPAEPYKMKLAKQVALSQYFEVITSPTNNVSKKIRKNKMSIVNISSIISPPYLKINHILNRLSSI